jgi:putative Holliday junction resolvase
VRVLGLDLGRRRTGVAVSDSAGLVATPHGVIDRTDDDPAFRRAVAAAVEETGAEAVVVGLPLSLDGSVGQAAEWAQAEAQELASLLGLPVHLHDERLTTVTAARVPAGAGSRRRGRKPVIDAGAAAIMLQSWLDSARREVG